MSMNLRLLIQALTLTLLLIPLAAAAELRIQITGGAERAVPIAVIPFLLESDSKAPSDDVAEIISNNLRRSGKFDPLARRDLIDRPHRMQEVRFQQWRALGIDNLITGTLKQNADGSYDLRFELLDVYTNALLAGRRYRVQEAALRSLAHSISDLIYETLTGLPGAYSTRLAYIQVDEEGDGRRTHRLLLADSDGMRPETILTSKQPLMSPSWSPDGKQLAYVSFEDNGRSAIYVQTVATGERRRVSSHPGINSAPAWSPDGKRLAMTLSRDGSPNINVLDLESGLITRITRTSAIDTEPTWSPDGRSIYFTSDRGGRPQIYRVDATGGAPQRITFDGSYNARPAVSPDGRLLAMVHRDDAGFRIAVMDLQTRDLHILTDGGLDESPGFAPNGEMIVYSRSRRDLGQLATVSIHGRVNMVVPVIGNQARDPAWSPR